jgi:hypothetical protein
MHYVCNVCLNLSIFFFIAGQIPVVPLNYTALSTETPFERDTVESCVREVLTTFNRSLSSKQNVEFTFAGIGRLTIRDKKVKMKFYKEFITSMDGSGQLLNALKDVSLCSFLVKILYIDNKRLAYCRKQSK